MATSDTARQPLALRRVESVPPGATVRHVDQLDDSTLARFLELLAGDPSASDSPAELEAGEVVVFTDYYQVTTA